MKRGEVFPPLRADMVRWGTWGHQPCSRSRDGETEAKPGSHGLQPKTQSVKGRTLREGTTGSTSRVWGRRTCDTMRTHPGVQERHAGATCSLTCPAQSPLKVSAE